MASLESIHATTLRDTLLAISGLPALVAWNGQSKIFWLGVDGDVPLPYIVTKPIAGGEDSDFTKSAASDMMWEVCATTATAASARDLADKIGQLRRMMPVTTNVPAVGYTYITEIMPINRRRGVQNNPIFEVGGLFRLRLSLD